MKRLTSSILGVIILATGSPLIADLELVRVWPGYREAASFTAATEYFGGPAAKSNQAARRTQPQERAGYYWLVRTKSDTGYGAASALLEVTRAGSTQPISYEFSWDIPAGNHAVPLGITGADWANSDEVPIAWRLTIFSSQGTQLASSQSFLWQNL
ncbi:MAG: hypothetical protein SynsKO_37030 [Synoicihabitans sp.]